MSETLEISLKAGDWNELIEGLESKKSELGVAPVIKSITITFSGKTSEKKYEAESLDKAEKYYNGMPKDAKNVTIEVLANYCVDKDKAKEIKTKKKPSSAELIFPGYDAFNQMAF